MYVICGSESRKPFHCGNLVVIIVVVIKQLKRHALQPCGMVVVRTQSSR